MGTLSSLQRAARGRTSLGLGPQLTVHAVALLVLGVAWLAGQHDQAVVGFLLHGTITLGLWIRSRQLRGRRVPDRRHVDDAARRMGLEPALDLHVGLLPFPLFRVGESRGFDNVYTRVIDDRQVWIFDFWHTITVHGREFVYTYTCAVTALDAECPKLRLARENPWTRSWAQMGWSGIELESGVFNRRFKVSGDDQTFAFAVLDPAMIHWLVSTPKQFEFAIEREWALVYAPGLPLAKWWTMLRMIRDFRERIPARVERLFRRHPRPVESA